MAGSICTTGSSPLARGKLGGMLNVFSHVRFIPTRAGKIAGGEAGSDYFPVHPHSRGENLRQILQPWSHQGSSPLARGKLGLIHDAVLVLGFIPTRAGKIWGWGKQ